MNIHAIRMTKTIDILDQARTALLHGEPHQRFNMAAIITDHLAQLRAAVKPGGCPGDGCRGCQYCRVPADAPAEKSGDGL